jgi:hypothetical protein
LRAPSIIERLSGALTALACTFVFDANSNVYCIYPALREARRLKLGIEVAALMSLSAYQFVFLTYFFSEMIFGFQN